jgi:hypothetical protein
VRFRKGQSGNPRGAAKGKSRKTTQFLRDLVMPAAPEIIGNVVKKAKTGDEFATKAYLTLLPTLRYVTPPIPNFPLVKTAQEATEQIAAITRRMAKGELDTDSGNVLINTLKTFIIGYTATELELEVMKARAREQGKKP